MMRDPFDRIYEQLEGLIPGLRELKQGDYRKSVSGGFMDLHLNVLIRTENELRIALSHYYKQNGDSIADPDMEIRVYLLDGWRKAEALTYQDVYTYNEVYPRPGIMIPSLKRSLNEFLTFWLSNLKKQGHKLNPPQ